MSGYNEHGERTPEFSAFLERVGAPVAEYPGPFRTRRGDELLALVSECPACSARRLHTEPERAEHHPAARSGYTREQGRVSAPSAIEIHINTRGCSEPMTNLAVSSAPGGTSPNGTARTDSEVS